HRGVWFRSAAGRPGSRPGSPRGDPAVAVESSLDVAVGWVCAWAWSFLVRRECRKTTIISGRVGEEKPRSKAPILSDRSQQTFSVSPRFSTGGDIRYFSENSPQLNDPR